MVGETFFVTIMNNMAASQAAYPLFQKLQIAVVLKKVTVTDTKKSTVFTDFKVGMLFERLSRC